MKMRATALAVALCAAALAPTAAVAAAGEGVQEIGFFAPSVVNPAWTGDQKQYRNQLRPFVDATARRLLTLDFLGGVAAYDLDSLQPTSRSVLALPGPASVTVSLPGRMLFAVSDGGTGTPTSSLEAVSVVRGKPQSAGHLALGPASLGGAQQQVVAAAAQPGSPYVYLLSTSFDATGFAAVPKTTNVSLVDTTGLSAGTAKVLWNQPLPDCVTPARYEGTQTAAPFGYSAATRSLLIGCSAPVQLGAKVPSPVGVARLGLTGTGTAAPKAGTFALYPFPGTVSGYGIWDARTERLLLETNTSSGDTLYSFDALSSSYVGGLGVGGTHLVTIGLDAVHGRFYGISGEIGLVTADLAPVPTDLGHLYPEFHTHGGNSPSFTNVAVDATTGRLFVSYNAGGFTILRDTVPYYRPVRPLDLDAGTHDLAERPGSTGADFSAGAQAYGAVYRQVGGTNNLQFNAVPFVVNVSPVSGGTRELDLAFLNKLSLDGRSASASTITIERDKANTQADEQRIPPGTPAKWPYVPVFCSDFGGSPKSAGTTQARVACDGTRSAVTSGAVAGPSEAVAAGSDVPVIEVGESSYTSSATRTAADGVLSTVTSTAKGISVLGGVLRIGQVQVTAQARAHGRPGTATGRFDRTVSRVELNGTPLCSTECDVQQLAAQVNASLAGHVHISFPSPDAAGAKGSPRGASTIVRRQLPQQIEAELLDEQDPTHQEVPGMVVTVYEENNVPSRTIALLAGAAVEAHYLIYPLGAPVPDDAPPPAGDGSPAPGAVPPALLGGPPGTVQPSDGPTPTTAGPGSDAGDVVTGLRNSLRFAFNGVGSVLRLLSVWMVLLLPVYLSARRWLLLRRAVLVEGAP